MDQSIKAHQRSAKSIPVVPATAKRLKLISEMQQLPEYRTSNTAPDMAGDVIGSLSDIKLNKQLKMELDNTELIKGLVVKELGQSENACFSYGPITSETSMTALRDWFSSNRIQVTTREEYDQEKVMFWIYLAPGSDTKAATATLQELQDKGIKDYRLIRRGNFRNAISLGLFSTRERVDRRLSELNAKGYKPVVVPYHDAGVNTIYWIDVVFDQSSGEFEHILNGVPGEYDSLPIDCSNIALAPVNP